MPLLSGTSAALAADPATSGAAAVAPADGTGEASQLSSQPADAGVTVAPRSVAGERPAADGELVGRRTESSRTMQLPDGRLRTELSAGPVHFRDSAGRWARIDTRLVDDGSGRGRARPAASGVVPVLPERLSDGPLTVTAPAGSAGQAGVSLGMQLVGTDPAAPAALTSGASRRWAGVLPGVDVTVQALPAGVKETLVLAGPGSPSQFTFDLTTSPGGSLRLGRTGAVDVLDGTGVVVGVLPRPFMDEQAGLDGTARTAAHSDAVSYGLTATGEGAYRLTLTADRTWLAAPERRWPVLVDPTTFLNGNSTVGNVSTPIINDSRAGTNLSNYQVQPVGSDATTKYRTLMRFDELAVVPTDAVVETATLELSTAAASVPGVAQTVQVRAATAAWDLAQVSWNNRTSSATWTTAGGDLDPTSSGSAVFPAAGGSVSIPISRLTADWVAGTRPNNGLALRAAAETGGQVDNVYGTNASGGRPQLQVTWLPRLSLGKAAQTFDRQLTDSHVAKVNLANGNLIVQASDLDITAPGLPTSVVRTYNSRGATLNSPVGYGWNVETGGRVNGHVGTDGRFQITRPDGQRWLLEPNGTGGFTSPADLDADLVVGSGIYTLTFRTSGTKLVFRSSDGMNTSTVDRNGNTQTYTYSTTILTADGLPYLDIVTDTVGRALTLSRSYYLTGISDHTSRGVTYDVTSDRLLSVTGTDSKVTSYANDSTGRLEQITSPRGNKTRFTYDSQNRVTSLMQVTGGTTTNPTGPTSTFTYTDPTAPGGTGTVALTDPNNHTTTYTHDVRDRITKTVDATGKERSASYNPNDSVTSAIDAMGSGSTPGNTTTYGYDTDYRPSGATAPAGATGSTGAASTTTYTETPGTVTSRTGHWLPSGSTGPDGGTTAQTYDTVGNVATTQDTTPAGSGGTATLVSYTYNPPAPASGPYTPTCGGKPGQTCTATDGRNKVTSFTYNTLGELTGINNPAPLGDPAFTYDSLSRVSTATDGKGQTTGYSYDGAGRLTQTRYAGTTTCTSAQITAGTCITTGYDDDGNVANTVDQTGTSIYLYDALNRETNRSLPSTGQTSTNLDASGNVLAAIDAGGTTSYTYNTLNQLTSLAEPGGSCTSTPTVRCTTFTYDPNGRRTTTTYPTSPLTVMTTTYDNSGTITNIKGVSGTNPAHSDLSYTHTRLVGSTTTDGLLTRSRTDNTATGTTGKTTTYTPDSLGQLTNATETNTAGTTTAAWTYTYDHAGNRLTATQNPQGTPGSATTAFTYNDANQIQTRNGSATGFSYDGNGNETAAIGSTTRTAGTWNPKQQLTSVTVGATTTPFTYTGEGNNTRLTAGATSYRNTALGVTATTTNGTTTNTIRDPRGTLIATRTGTTSHYYLFDALGSVVALISPTGQKVNSYTYDPYGQNRAKTEAITNPYQYTSGILDTATGLYKLGIRYYDPTLGRFTQTDPTGQDPHYTYAHNNPMSFVDPTGASILGLGAAADLASLAIDILLTLTPGGIGVRVATAIAGLAKDIFLATHSGSCTKRKLAYAVGSAAVSAIGGRALTRLGANATQELVGGVATTLLANGGGKLLDSLC
ncbi:MAG: sle [Frankiales bacterium]|nr:sle [Frankiales bacterium]